MGHNFYEEFSSTPLNLDGIVREDSITVSLTHINSLNIFINDSECSGAFIESIYQSLDRDGIRYSFSRKEENLNIDDAVIITLDQQYVSGPKVSIIGPYNNNRSDNSDALALAMHTAFNSRNIDNDGIFCGKRGYRQENSGISTRIPTPTEEAVLSSTNTSFVTIAFGTNTPDAEEIACAIKEGLGRYIAYISTNTHIDLLYRTEPSDTLDGLAQKFETTSFDVSNTNNLGETIPSDQAIINPEALRTRVFDNETPVIISEKTDVITFN